MIEKTIDLEEVEPVNIFGINNIILEKLKRFFPKVSIIGRGNEIKVIGGAEEIEIVEQRINILLDHYKKYNNLNPNHVDNLILDSSNTIKELDKQHKDALIYGATGKVIKPRTPHQIILSEKSHQNDLCFAIGPAGTGKTYVAIALAVRALRNRRVKRIILSRPAVEAEEHLGFLPGDMKDKLDPYLQPLYDALHDMIPARKLGDFMADGVIQIAPLAFMRGRTLSNAFVILDEAQNATTNQLKMFLTRMGENSKFIVTGDITQIDLPKKQNSGLIHAEKLLKTISGISFIHFDKQDIVRHALVKDIVDAYTNNQYKEK